MSSKQIALDLLRTLKKEGSTLDDLIALIEVLDDIGNYRNDDTEYLTVEQRIINIFRELGFSSNCSGYDYLSYAVKMSVYDPPMIKNLSSNVFPEVANHFNTTVAAIKRAMFTAIENAFNYCDDNTKCKYFGPAFAFPKGRPTIKQFIIEISRKIRIDMNH